MRETQQIDLYLMNRLLPEDRLLIDANALINPELREKLFFQKQTHVLIRDFGRKKIKAEIELVHHRLFTEDKFKSFKQKITSIFKK